MKTEDELRAIAKSIQRTVNQGMAIGLGPHPQTVLEKHAFELGRLQMVLSLLPPAPPPADSGASVYETCVGRWQKAYPNKTPPSRKMFDDMRALLERGLRESMPEGLEAEPEPPTP